MAATHSWEVPQDAWGVRPDVGVGAGGDDEFSDSDLSDGPILDPQDEFIEFALDLLNFRCLNARQFCTMMFFAGRAGLGKCKKYGHRPGAPSGHYARHLDPILGFKHFNTKFYEVKIPSHSKVDMSRTMHTSPMLMPHETLIYDMIAEPGAITKLNEQVTSNSLPPCYYEHVVVRNNAGMSQHVVPIDVYLDFVPYTITDSVLGVWVHNIITNRRYLVAVLRKRTLCTCGCKGWCSFHSLFAALTWSLRSLAHGRWPNARHDGEAWGTMDVDRARRAGEVMPLKAAVLYIRGDWAEYAHTLGLPAWNDGLRPCYECVGFGSDLYNGRDCSAHGLRWRCNDEDAYQDACRRCEIRLRLTARTRTDLVVRLQYDRRDTGPRGRALCREVPGLLLVVGDRLEPSETLPNVDGLDALAMPATVTFWRRSEETLTRHRNPLFAEDIGISMHKSLTVDTLHTLYLGVMNAWCKLVVWLLLLSGLYGDAATGFVGCVLSFRHRLMEWYKARHRRFPTENLTRVSDFTKNMVGKRTAPKMKTKGAETWGVLLFLIHELRLQYERLGERAVRLLLAGEALENMIGVWNKHGRVLPAPAVEDNLSEQLIVQCFLLLLEAQPSKDFCPLHKARAPRKQQSFTWLVSVFCGVVDNTPVSIRSASSTTRGTCYSWSPRTRSFPSTT